MVVTGARRLLLGQPAGDNEPAPYTASETVVLLVAAVAGVMGLIHATVAVDQLDNVPAYAHVNGLLAAVEIGWAMLLLRRSSFELLLFGCAFNVLLVALWIAAVAGGLSAAPRPLVPGSATGLHALFWCTATAGGSSGGWAATLAAAVQPLADVVSGVALLSVMQSPRVAFARQVRDRTTPLLLAVLFVAVVYGVGAHGS